MKKKIITFCLLLSFINMLFLPVSAKSITVPAGRTIPISYIGEKITDKTVKSGDTIVAQIHSDVTVDGVIVFKTGDQATINVADVKKNGFVGIAGAIMFANGTATDVNGKIHPVQFTYKVTGEEKTWPKVMLGCGVFIILAPLALFGFVRGGHGELLPNQSINATLLNDFTLETL